MQPGDQPRSRLNDEMNRRRLQLRLKWKTVAERAELSVAHFSRIRNGTSPLSDLAASGIETALQWPAGTIEEILVGIGTDASATAEPAPESKLGQREAEPLPALPDPDGEQSSVYESTLKDILAAMQEELRELNAKIDALSSEREADQREADHDVRDQKRA